MTIRTFTVIIMILRTMIMIDMKLGIMNLGTLPFNSMTIRTNYKI